MAINAASSSVLFVCPSSLDRMIAFFQHLLRFVFFSAEKYCVFEETGNVQLKFFSIYLVFG